MTREAAIKIAKGFVEENYKGSMEEVGQIERVVLIVEDSNGRPTAIPEHDLELYKNAKATWAVTFGRIEKLDEAPFPRGVSVDVDNETRRATFFKTL